MQPAFDPVLEESQQAAMKQFPVPAFGQTRCYWSLLDSDLRYLYLDPTCFVHMGDQAEAVIGTCLLDYVHPDEQHSARADLGNVLASRTLHGSVTRVRYARLSRIRAILGCNAPEPFPDAHIVTVDEHYIACDVVINWVSDNVVLCFLHAIVGKTTDPEKHALLTTRETTLLDKGKADNDELNKTQWTNWCGTSAMTTDHAAGLFDRLRRLVPPSSTPPDRIFQILINQPARPILFSWPPEGYTAGEFGKLVHRMQIGTGGDNHPRSEDGAKTSCTRRYKANQRILEGGVLKDVESIFIPHGAVIFACHKVVATHSNMQRPDMYPNYHRQQGSHYPSQPHQQSLGPYDNEARRGVSDAEYSASGVPESPEYAHSRVATSGYQRGPAEYGGPQYARNGDYAHGPYVQQPYPGPYSIPPNQQRNHVYAPAPPHAHPDHRSNEGWGYSQQPPAQPSWPASNPRTTSPRPPAGYEGGQSWMAAQGWTQGPVEQAHPQQHPQPQQGYAYPSSQQFGPPPVPAQQQQPMSPPPPYAPNTPVSQPPTHLEPPPQTKRDPSPADEETTIPRVHAPPKRKRESMPKRELNGTPDLAHADGEGPGGLQPSPPSKDVIARERGHSTGMTASRAGGAPPPGVLRCSSCKNETSPEWRKGPSGKKDLCNACGLRYARSKQKKDGAGAPKRRRDKEIPLAPAPAPTAPPLSLRPAPMAPSSSSSTAPPWPNPGQLAEDRQPKRQRSGTLGGTTPPSPPQSQPSSYDGQYGQPVYPHGYANGYGMEYGRMPPYAPEVAPSDRPYPSQ